MGRAYNNNINIKTYFLFQSTREAIYVTETGYVIRWCYSNDLQLQSVKNIRINFFMYSDTQNMTKYLNICKYSVYFNDLIL